MLTLADAQHLGACTVYRDVTWRDGTRALTPTFYVLDDAPHLATADDGGPDYTFFWYRGARPAESGGLLTLTVTSTPTASDELLTAIRSAYALAPDAPVTLAPVPVDSGTVSLSFAGETGVTGTAGGAGAAGAAGGEFAAAVLGGGPTRQTGQDRTTFAVALTADGAALLAGALGQGSAVLHAEYDLQIPFVLDDVEVHVWCDTAAAWKTAGDLEAAGTLTSSTLVEAVTTQHLAGSATSSRRPLSAEEQAALTDLATSVLADALPAALLDSAGKVRPYDSRLDQHLDLQLTATYPAQRRSVVTANLVLPTDPNDRAGREQTFDLSADQLLERYEISAPGDMAALSIAAIGVRLDYAGTTAGGLSLTRTADVRLRPTASVAVVAFDLATADQRSVDPHVTVQFADGSPPYEFDLAPTTSTLIDLDLDTLGVLAVDVGLGAGVPGVSASAVVELHYGATGTLAATLVLDGGSPTGSWRPIVREVPLPYHWRVTWVAGSTRLVGEWQTDTRRQLRLDAPPELAPPTSTVTFLSAGDFSALASVLVEVRDGPGAAVDVLTFSAADQTATWAAQSVPCAYQLRQTDVLSSGAHVTGEWSDDTRTVQIVRDALRLDLEVVPNLLGLGTAARRAIVEVQGPDPTAAIATVVLDTPTDHPHCAIRLVDPNQRSYRYRVTVSPLSGPAQTSEWRAGTSTILVVLPPS